MNHKLISRVKQSLDILETEDYENDVVLPDEFLKVNLYLNLNSNLGLNSTPAVAGSAEILTIKACECMAKHLRAMADEFESQICFIKHCEEQSALSDYIQLIKK